LLGSLDVLKPNLMVSQAHQPEGLSQLGSRGLPACATLEILHDHPRLIPSFACTPSGTRKDVPPGLNQLASSVGVVTPSSDDRDPRFARRSTTKLAVSSGRKIRW
jgi:hypothetical protein